jgi:hypothetical protein
MRPFVWRELTIVVRRPAFAAAAAVHAGLLFAFLLLWGEGMPILPGTNVYEQLSFLQGALLVALLPWASARCAAAERGDALVMLAALTATRPSRVLMGQCIGRFAALSTILAAGVPALLLAQQMSAVPGMHVTLGLLPPVLLCGAVSLLTSWFMLANPSRLTGWLWATACVIGLSSLARFTGLISEPVIFAVAALLAFADLMTRADSRFRHLSEIEPRLTPERSA